MKLKGWAGFPECESDLEAIAWHEQVSEKLNAKSVTLRGCGRSYGDSALGSNTLSTQWLDKIHHFDKSSGVITVDAGISIDSLLQVIVPFGWFMPVSPGSRFVSIGGCVASDVHGKNHHISGCISQHIINIKIYTPESGIIDCSDRDNAVLFHATCGGMGLTGIILSVTLQLRKINSSFISQQSIKTDNLDHTLETFAEYEHVEYTVAWIDSLSTGKKQGRAVILVGTHDDVGELRFLNSKKISVPSITPGFFINKLSISWFNSLYYHKASSKNTSVHYEPFFYPLDQIKNWNNLYGKRGFVQYQFVIPKAAGIETLKELLAKIATSGNGSFLTVLKVFGEQNSNLLSFPLSGYTVALDFQIKPGLFEFLDKLDQFLSEVGGRTYLTKDARMTEQSFKKFYPNWEKFQEIRAKYGCIETFTSLQSRRLGLG